MSGRSPRCGDGGAQSPTPKDPDPGLAGGRARTSPSLTLGRTDGAFAPAASDPAGNAVFVGTEWLGSPDAWGMDAVEPTTTSFRHVFAGLEVLPEMLTKTSPGSAPPLCARDP